MANKPTETTETNEATETVAHDTISTGDSVQATATALVTVEPEETAVEAVKLGEASNLYPPLAMTTSELLDEINDAMGGEEISPAMLTNVQLPLGGGSFFRLPVLNEDEEDPQRETFEGIILAYHIMRTMWVKAFGSGTGEATPPDCSSPDGLVGVGMYGYGSEGNPSGTCANCPMAQFGSAVVGRGQQCKLKAVIYMLLPGHRFPVRLILPPTSLSQKDPTGWKTYRQRLAAMAGGHPSSVITQVGIRQAPFGQGRNASSYAVATFKAVGPKLTDTEKARARALAESLRHALIPASPAIGSTDLLDAPSATGAQTASDF